MRKSKQQDYDVSIIVGENAPIRYGSTSSVIIWLLTFISQVIQEVQFQCINRLFISWIYIS